MLVFHPGMPADLAVYRSLLRGVTVVVANPQAPKPVLLRMASYLLDAEARAELAEALADQATQEPEQWRPELAAQPPARST